MSLHFSDFERQVYRAIDGSRYPQAEVSTRNFRSTRWGPLYFSVLVTLPGGVLINAIGASGPAVLLELQRKLQQASA